MTKKLFYFVIAAALICGASVFTSCVSSDNPTPKSTLPKCYDLIADEYKEVILDSMLWINIASIRQDQGESFTIESPKPGAQLTIHYYRPDNAGQDVTPVVYYCLGGG